MPSTVALVGRVAVPLLLVSLIAAGCSGDAGTACDDQARQEVQRLRAKLTKIEQDLQRQSQQIDALSAQITAKAEATPAAGTKVAARPAEQAAPAPVTPAPGPAPAGAGSAPTGTAQGTEPPAAEGTDAQAARKGPLAFDEFTLKVQRALKRAGYDPGPEDGRKGTQTTRAIQAFQRENNLRESGMADEATWALLKRYLE